MKFPELRKNPARTQDELIEIYGHDWFFWMGAMLGGCLAAIFDIAWYTILIVSVFWLGVSTLKFYTRSRKLEEHSS